MRIIFMGTPAFAVPSLNILIENKYDIVSVVTVPDRKKGRGLRLEFSDVKKSAIENGLNILQPEKLKDENFLSEIRILKPDLIIVVAFRILPVEFFSIPGLGTFNLHASLLPKYRGAAPINHAIMNGETETGVTTFFLKEKVDTGNIILQEMLSIEESDNAGTLHDKLSILGAGLVLKTVRLIESGKVELKIQDDSIATKAPKIFREDCVINWAKDANEVHNLIRGLSPHPGAFTLLNGRCMKILKTSLTNSDAESKPGSLLIKGGGLYVATGGSLLEILEIQPENKRKMTGMDFINGLTAEQKTNPDLAFETS